MNMPTIPQTLYEQNYPLWLQKTTEFLRARNFIELDTEHLIKELEEMGGSRKDTLENNLIVVLAHLLKWKYQPSRRCGSWRGSLKEHRRRINKALVQLPGLEPYFREIFAECYPPAKDWATKKPGLPDAIFPESCPFTAEESLNPTYFPD